MNAFHPRPGGRRHVPAVNAIERCTEKGNQTMTKSTLFLAALVASAGVAPAAMASSGSLLQDHGGFSAKVDNAGDDLRSLLDQFFRRIVARRVPGAG
jgi:hypothetical protein